MCSTSLLRIVAELAAMTQAMVKERGGDKWPRALASLALCLKMLCTAKKKPSLAQAEPEKTH